MKHAPHQFYRYRGFNVNTIESLSNDELFFANPTDFNDPFDCNPIVKSDSDIGTLRNILKELVQRRVCAETLSALKRARLSGNNATVHATNAGAQESERRLRDIAYRATDPYYTCSAEVIEQALLTSELQKELLRQYDRGICCFSTNFNNPLLWSHYGDQHRGICIGYGLDRRPKPEIYPVQYGGTRTVNTSLIARAILEKNEAAIDALDNSILLRKAPEWRYEKEWRILGPRGTQESCLMLTDVTFGLRCSDALKHSLISALMSRTPLIKFFAIGVVQDTFKLKRWPIQFDELNRYYPKTALSGMEAFGEE